MRIKHPPKELSRRMQGTRLTAVLRSQGRKARSPPPAQGILLGASQWNQFEAKTSCRAVAVTLLGPTANSGGTTSSPSSPRPSLSRGGKAPAASRSAGALSRWGLPGRQRGRISFTGRLRGCEEGGVKEELKTGSWLGQGPAGHQRSWSLSRYKHLFIDVQLYI